MLSILIPIYNYDVRPLVESLQRQALQLALPFEIRCYDDGSLPELKAQNREIALLEGVNYKELPQNIGRSAIRNLLAKEAAFSKLIFLDCDVLVINEDYLQSFLRRTDKVVYGGRVYEEERPEKKYRLRWVYGHQRESALAAERINKPYLHFMTCNFMVERTIFLKSQFNENLREYGFEDTFFALELEELGIQIGHIDNPVLTHGLDESAVFLRKTYSAVKNLGILYKHDEHFKQELTQIKLLKAFLWTKRFQLGILIKPLFFLFQPIIRMNLTSAWPSLFLFDCYKLGLLFAKEKN